MGWSLHMLLVVGPALLWAPLACGQPLRGSSSSSSSSSSSLAEDTMSPGGRFLLGLAHMAAHGHDLKHASKGSEKAPPEDAASRDVEFEEAFSQLKIYYGENKHSVVPQSVEVTLSDGTPFKLGKWVQRQRQLYKNTFVTPGQRKDFGQMTDGQKAQLTTLQFKFDPTPLPAPVDWNIPYQALVDFKNKHGHTNVPEKTPYGDASADLGKWAQRQRQLHKNTFVTPGARKGFGQLSEDKKSKLESIGFSFKE